MFLPRTRSAALLVALFSLLLLGLTSTASAGPSGKWTKFTGPHANTAELGLARTPDGRLHALSEQDDSGNGGTVNATTLSADAKTVSGPVAVYSYPNGLNPSMALISVPGGLRGFFSGLQSTDTHPLQGGLASATSADGSSWAIDPALVSNDQTPGKSSVYAASGISAALATDGTPVTAWGDSGSGYHFGLLNTTPDVRYSPGGSVYKPAIGVDAATGEVVLAWQFIQISNGTVYQPIQPAGARVQPPGANAASTSTRTAISGRIGAPGVFLAYQYGDNQFLSTPAVIRIGSSTPIRFRREKGAEDLGIAAAPGGRMWVFWKRSNKLVAVRSNPSMTKFGAAVRINPPKGTSVIYNLAGEGSGGPLDLLALVDRSGALDYWHQRILPGLTLKCKSATGKINCKVTDAGTPVKGAKVKAGGKSKKTTASGKAAIALPQGKYKVKATKSGYKPAKASARSK